MELASKVVKVESKIIDSLPEIKIRKTHCTMETTSQFIHNHFLHYKHDVLREVVKMLIKESSTKVTEACQDSGKAQLIITFY
jgi:hypothetical protein